MSSNISTFYAYRTPYGILSIQSSLRGVTQIHLGDATLMGRREPSALTNQAANEILEYLSGKRRLFEVRLDPQGSEFQKTVWEALCHIPYGTTQSTTAIARLIGNPSSYRAVGQAIKKNPLPILVPDHRVAGSGNLPSNPNVHARLRKALLTLERDHNRR